MDPKLVSTQSIEHSKSEISVLLIVHKKLLGLFQSMGPCAVGQIVGPKEVYIHAQTAFLPSRMKSKKKSDETRQLRTHKKIVII